MTFMNRPGRHPRPAAAAEEEAIAAARASRETCLCGEAHSDHDGITPALLARMRGYLAMNPGQQFAYDDEAGIVAVIIPHDPAPPDIIAWSDSLPSLLDIISAPPAAELS